MTAHPAVPTPPHEMSECTSGSDGLLRSELTLGG